MPLQKTNQATWLRVVGRLGVGRQLLRSLLEFLVLIVPLGTFRKIVLLYIYVGTFFYLLYLATYASIGFLQCLLYIF